VLTQVAGAPVCPSDDVDQAWHLHITRTADYERFCRDVLGRFLHHRPAEAGRDEHERHRAMYAETLKAYRRTFRANAPADVWPDVERRFAPAAPAPAAIRLRGVLASGPWLGVIALLAVAALAIALHASGVLDATHEIGGPAFLRFAGPATLALLVLGWLSTSPFWRKQPGDTLDAYEAAWLAGGAGRVTATAIGLLLDRGALALQRTQIRKGRRTRTTVTLVVQPEPPQGLHPIELACLAAASGGTLDFERAHAALQANATELRDRLRGAGLATDDGVISPARAAAAGLTAAWLAIELERALHAIPTARPVAFLMLLMMVGTALLLVLALRASRSTWRGYRAVRELELALRARRARHARAGSPAGTRIEGRLLPMMLALLGPAGVLAYPGFSDFDDALGAHGMRLAGGDGSSGDGGSGSGCGGGGGGCGGGCGG
jgi:uncharacterized protein (TIGR04222 family)